MAIPLGRRPQEPTKPWLTDSYHVYLRSDAWQLVRRSALARAGNRCQMRPPWAADERCTETAGLQVHHRNYRNLGHEGPDDVIVLCERCHELEHRRISASRLDEARLDGWATKKWGDNWRNTIDEGLAQTYFDEWLDRRGGE